MSGGGITEFLSELSESESLSALREAYNRNSPLVVKLETQPAPVRIMIGTFADRRIIVAPDPPGVVLPTDRELSLKFNIGTEVYFIKTTIKSFTNRYYIDMNTKVIQLKRRREARFTIPKNWSQSGSILLPKQGENIRCNVIDISKSGIRFEVLDLFQPRFQRDDIIKIKFQIHKRAEVNATAIVRFVLHRPALNSLLGMEFATDVSDVNQQRIASIVDDIQLFLSTQRT